MHYCPNTPENGMYNQAELAERVTSRGERENGKQLKRVYAWMERSNILVERHTVITGNVARRWNGTNNQLYN